ncbi:hypothetical protein Pdw03_5716 [Penicillium digitatum]|uniref:Uncharacterized protein n=1 Tax=Penicillium digitatum TaxID=36651 RepID=A0A7T7BQF3_PENDI|nr:hypothetical protein Pdw03_5716 [Penicillium digitatum]
MRQRGDFYDLHSPCHVQPVTPYSRDHHHLHLSENGNDAFGSLPYNPRQASRTLSQNEQYQIRPPYPTPQNLLSSSI